MEEYLKLENLYNEIQLIEDVALKDAIQFIFDRAGAEACLGFLSAPDFFAVMQEKNVLYGKIDPLMLQDFFEGYQAKMLGEGGLE